jgi:NADH-quinone oxidoreductase subunit G
MAINLTIDGKPVSVPPGTVVADAAKKVGVNIPVFCYHPKLEPVGMCRMCLVEIGAPQVDRATRQPVLDANGQPVIAWMPKLQTACTTPVSDGMAVRTNTQVVKDAQRAVLEFLLTSHPLDCPICDKGGECPLQNLTLGYGPGETRFEYSEKQRLDKRVPLGDLILLDRERCIQCARCIRFQDEIADDHVLGFYERGRTMEIVTFSEPGFDSHFSGNTTDVCPVGALTTRDFHFRARPWELTNVPSLCNHCAVGCNTTLGTRRSARAGGGWEILRVMPRQNEQVNEIWMCDKGRFGHYHVRSLQRLWGPMVRDADGVLQPATWDDALSLVAGRLKAADERVLGLVGDRLANEDLYLFVKLFREGLGYPNMQVRPRVAGHAIATQYGVATGTNFGTMGKGAAIFVIAGDVEEEAPVWFLRIRGAVKRGAALVVANGRTTKLDRYTAGLRYRYGTETQLVLGLLNVILSENLVKPEVAARIDGLDELGLQVAKYTPSKVSGATGVAQEALVNAARTLAHATDAVFIFGREGVPDGEALAQAVANLAIVTGHVARPNNGLLRLLPHNNSQGAADLILTSDLQPPTSNVKTAYVVGTDPVGDGEALPAARDAFVIVQELFLTETAKRADVVLPVVAFAERDGTYTNAERRVQRFYAALPVTVDARPDWEIFWDIGRRMGMDWRYTTAEEVMEELARSVPAYAGMTYARLMQTEAQWPPVGAQDLYFGGTAYDNRGGLGAQYPAACETMERFAVAWAEPPAPPPARGNIIAVPVRRLYQRGTLIAQHPKEGDSHALDSRTLAPCIELCQADADRLGIADGDVVTVTLPSGERELTARVNSQAPQGAALVPDHITTNITLTNVSKK